MTRKPMEFMQEVSRGEIERDAVRADLDAQHPDFNSFLGVAKVVNVNAPEEYYTLKILIGSHDEFERVPIPITHSAKGKRHGIMAIPEIGDYCIVGWMPQETSEGRIGTKTPVPLRWITPGVWPGRDWLTTSNFTADEYDAGSVKDRALLRGTLERARHKTPPMQPGNVALNSSQGADLFLDENATLMSRDGSEIHLRDADSAIVTRSIQMFQNTAGISLRHGPVQRDARLLATTMVSDGFEWDGPLQSLAREPIREDQLPLSNAPEDFLTPARVLAKSLRDPSDGYIGKSALRVNSRIDPYTFLQQGGFIDASGFVLDESHRADAVYAGKSFFRVAAQSLENGALNDAPTLTEFRIDFDHTTDGTMPVNEQTDGFNSNGIPRTDKDTSDPIRVRGKNFLTFALASVIGNDPVSQAGQEAYGLPLVPVVFDGGVLAPRLQPAKIVANKDTNEAPTPLGQQAATLLRISPLTAEGAPDTFVSYNKDGQLRGYISGPQSEDSVQLGFRGGVQLDFGGSLNLLPTGPARLIGKTGSVEDNLGAELSSERGYVRIFGGGSKKGAEALARRLGGAGEGEEGSPGVEIDSLTNTHIKANRKVMLKSEDVEANGRTLTLFGHQELNLQSADRVGLTTKHFQKTITGKQTSVFTGPKDLLPTNLALDDKTYTTIPGLPAKTTLIVFGDRFDDILIGNHVQSIRVGNFAYQVNLGTYTVNCGAAVLSLTPGSISSVAPGLALLESTAGTAVVSGTTNASLIAKAGPAVVRGSASIVLSAPADFNIGPIIAAGSLDPLTGLPFAAFGMGAKGHLITP